MTKQDQLATLISIAKAIKGISGQVQALIDETKALPDES